MATKTMDALMMEAVGIPIIPRKRKVPVPKDNEMLVKVAVVGRTSAPPRSGAEHR